MKGKIYNDPAKASETYFDGFGEGEEWRGMLE